jgi:hypothetical protein
MDPIATIALFCSILDLAERGIKTVKFAKGVYGSVSGQAKEHQQFEQFADEMQKIVDGLSGNYNTVEALRLGSKSTGEYIQEVVAICQNLLPKYKSVLDKCRAKKQRSIKASIGATLRSTFAKKEMEDLQRALEAQGSVLRTALASGARFVCHTFV